MDCKGAVPACFAEVTAIDRLGVESCDLLAGVAEIFFRRDIVELEDFFGAVPRDSCGAPLNRHSVGIIASRIDGGIFRPLY